MKPRFSILRKIITVLLLISFGLLILIEFGPYLFDDFPPRYSTVTKEISNSRQLSSLKPFLCIGWDRAEYVRGLGRMCPPGHAYFGNENHSGKAPGQKNKPGASVHLRARCCPLPSNDVLSEQHVMVLDRCPPMYVVTGTCTMRELSGGCKMRCTKINTGKYTLAKKRMAYAWTRGKARLSGRGQTSLVAFSDIPLALRLAESYASKRTMHGDGCIGVPFGSLLVEKQSSSCDGFFYAQLLYRESGKPVETVPTCKAIEGVYTQKPKCIPE